MADKPFDGPEKSTNGTSPKQVSSAVPAGSGHDQTLADSEQTLADSEQTLADSEQTLADADQTSRERDQSSADSDQVASDRDQAASDRDLASGTDRGEHDATRDIRRRTSAQRDLTAADRLKSAEERDATADARDLAGMARDRAAAARDLAGTQRDTEELHGAGRAVTGEEIVMRAADQRRRAARYRMEAADHRALAAEDRAKAAADREQGARDREQALADREALARALAKTEVDPLTGARTRAAGLIDLDHEADRSRRTGRSLVVVYIDVIGLKSTNDSEGHEAGDLLLQRAVNAIRASLRSYDLVVRLAGDEFLCAMSDMTLDNARGRFTAMAGALAASGEPATIRTGFAELASDEAVSHLIARADKELVDGRDV